MDKRYNASKSEGQHTITCPYCDSNHTELFSLFGQQLLTTQYYCNTCHTPFERIKDDDVLQDADSITRSLRSTKGKLS